MVKRGSTTETTPSQAATTGVQLLTSTLVAPVAGVGHPREEIDVYDLSDDGFSDSDGDEMYHDDDDHGYLRESPLPVDESPLDVAGAALEATPKTTSTTLGPPSKSSGYSTPSGSAPPTPGLPGQPPKKGRRRIFGRSKEGKTYNVGHEDKGIVGIVVMEIQNASDLPKLKNGTWALVGNGAGSAIPWVGSRGGATRPRVASRPVVTPPSE